MNKSTKAFRREENDFACRLRGLPFQSTEEEIRQFFEGALSKVNAFLRLTAAHGDRRTRNKRNEAVLSILRVRASVG